MNLMPAAFSTSAGKKWLVEPSVAPTVIWPGARLGVGEQRLHVFPRRLRARGEIDGVDETRQIGSKSV